MLDGHLSHYTLELFKAAAAKDVILFCLPPHTLLLTVNHLMQVVLVC